MPASNLKFSICRIHVPGGCPVPSQWPQMAQGNCCFSEMFVKVNCLGKKISVIDKSVNENFCFLLCAFCFDVI